MKIELVKTNKPDGDTYHTEVDGCYVFGSLELTEEKARAKYEFIKAHNGVLEVKEVIESVEI